MGTMILMAVGVIICIAGRIIFDIAVLIMPVAALLVLIMGVMVGFLNSLKNTVKVYAEVFLKK